MRTPIIAGNWKMYKNARQTGVYFDALRTLLPESHQCQIVVCPPFVNLQTAIDSTVGTCIEIGAQNLFWEMEGAYTGEVSADMLEALGCRWVLVGHSERRQYFGETDAGVCRKISAALACGLTPIVCIGELLAQREAGETAAVLEKHFQGGIAPLHPEKFAKVVIAYEPIWAIGTGRTATPELAAGAHGIIRGLIGSHYGAQAASDCRILYGGSVKPDNIRALMAEDDIDGALVGGASLDPASFASIVNY